MTNKTADIAARIAADIAARDARRAANASLPVAERIAADIAARDALSIAQQIEARAREMRAAGCNWPSVGEFVFLYGEAASAVDCADYLSVFDPATAPKFAGAADCGARGSEHCRHSWPHVCDACAALACGLEMVGQSVRDARAVRIA